jgi:D-amino-acid oxidase
VIVGGTADEDEWDLTPNPRTAEAILARASILVPALAGAPIRAHKVGLRPTRPAVRLEPEHRGPQTIIHNYGHGGAGVTLSWPCADEVVALLASADR